MGIGSSREEEMKEWEQRHGSNSMAHRTRKPPSAEQYSDDSDEGTVSRFHPDYEVTGAPRGGQPSLPPELALKCAQKRDLPRPKRAMSPYNCFVKAELAGGRQGRKQGADVTRQMTDLSSQWTTMSDDEKNPYKRAAYEDRSRYTREKAKYESDKSQIIKRPLNGYILFMREFRNRQKGNYKNAKDLVREGAKAWKRLSSEEKLPYNQRSLSDSDRYAQERFRWCNKKVQPRKNDTRFIGMTDLSDEPSQMDSSDQEADGME